MSTRKMLDRLYAALKYFQQEPKNLKILFFIWRDLEAKGLADIGELTRQAWFEIDLHWADLIFLDNISWLW